MFNYLDIFSINKSTISTQVDSKIRPFLMYTFQLSKASLRENGRQGRECSLQLRSRNQAAKGTAKKLWFFISGLNTNLMTVSYYNLLSQMSRGKGLSPFRIFARNVTPNCQTDTIHFLFVPFSNSIGVLHCIACLLVIWIWSKRAWISQEREGQFGTGLENPSCEKGGGNGSEEGRAFLI